MNGMFRFTFYEQNSIVNGVHVDDWVAELSIIACSYGFQVIILRFPFTLNSI